MPTQQPVRRSDKEILQFIKDLPGANVPQYAKLLNTTAIRINALLYDGQGAKLVKAGMVCAPEKGKMPSWAKSKTIRGSLRARDVDQMHRDGLLPPFINNLLSKVHSRFQDDALNFLRETLEQTANHTSFESQMTSFMDQDRHRTEAMLAGDDRILQLEGEIARVDILLGKHRDLADIMEHRLITETKKSDDSAPESVDA
jgi:hypothetical protein